MARTLRDWPGARPIHHEKWEAENITDRERDSGVGAFDVIEDADGFSVYQESDCLAVESTLEAANETAQRLADQFDAERVARGWTAESRF